MSENQNPALRLEPGLKPYAVKIPVASALLGGKARSEIYAAVGRKELDAIKDGAKTLITTASIERYMTKLPPAKIAPPKRQRGHKPRARKSAAIA